MRRDYQNKEMLRVDHPLKNLRIWHIHVGIQSFIMLSYNKALLFLQTINYEQPQFGVHIKELYLRYQSH